MKKIVDITVKRLEQGKSSVLLSIVQNVGSAPRHTGANMLVGENGYIAGTIGGGMLEFKATGEAVELLTKGEGVLKQYRLTKDEVAGLGMVCGGDVDVLFTVIKPTEENIKIFDEIQDCMNCYRKGSIALSLDGNGVYFADENAACKYADREKYYVQSLENTSRLYIFGGGHLAQELVPIASHLGFRCVVTDDRPEFATKELFPNAEALNVYNFDDIDDKFDIQPQDYIIAMTRGHMGDLDVQKFAMKTPAYYIGVVGSKSKIAAVNAKLREAGFTDSDIARITTPIGVKIHSETPAEIAISIAAQLIEKRAEYQRYLNKN